LPQKGQPLAIVGEDRLKGCPGTGDEPGARKPDIEPAARDVREPITGICLPCDLGADGNSSHKQEEATRE
jgi:hypothetical protein